MSIERLYLYMILWYNHHGTTCEYDDAVCEYSIPEVRGRARAFTKKSNDYQKSVAYIIGLVSGHIYRKVPYLVRKSMVYCRFYLRPTH